VYDEGKAEVERERETDEELDVVEEVEDTIKDEEEDILRCLVRKGKSMALREEATAGRGCEPKISRPGSGFL
jgi:hypothetical protein